MRHSESDVGARHGIHNFEYADESARTSATGFSAIDVGKVAKQITPLSYWLLASISPITWQEIAGQSDYTVPNVTSFPSGAANGQLVYHTTFQNLYVCINEAGDTTVKGNWKTADIEISNILTTGANLGDIIVADGAGGALYSGADGGTL